MINLCKIIVKIIKKLPIFSHSYFRYCIVVSFIQFIYQLLYSPLLGPGLFFSLVIFLRRR
jgi:hypothetical protein